MKDIIDKLKKFRDDRNWSQFHTPENIAKSIVLEAAELLENYQWKNDSADIENIKDELADIMTYCIYMCDTYELDIKTIINEKIAKNEKKYPVDKAFGKADKYNKL